MPRTNKDTLTPFSLPPAEAISDEAVQKAAKKYQKLVNDRKVAYHRLDEMNRRRIAAIEKDRLALAEALAEDKPDPGDKTVDKLDKDLENTRRIIEALEIAIDNAESALIGAVDDARSQWVEEVQTDIDAAAEEYATAISELEAARTKVAGKVAVRNFLNSFPEGKGYRAGHWSMFGLIAPSGDPFRWDQVVEALHKDVEVAITGRAGSKPPQLHVRHGEGEHTDQRFREAVMSGDRGVQ